MKLASLEGKPEIFYSLQGEGGSQGMPAVFIRLAGCNLACVWCDTSYALDVSSNAIEMDAAAVEAVVRSHACKRLVVTGGEPLIQQSAIVPFLRRFPDYVIELETNGTLHPNEELCELVDQFNVSPKLHHSGNAFEKALRVDVLKNYAVRMPDKTWFKFVIHHAEDMHDVLEIIKLCSMPLERVILMPQARTQAELAEIRTSVAELSLQHKMRFCDRLHMTLWGDKKGV